MSTTRFCDREYSDIASLIDSLPFGTAEAERLLKLKSSRRRSESLGALICLAKLTDGINTPRLLLRGASGKPYFADDTAPRFGLSHSGGYSAAAVGGCDIGFDMEAVTHRGDCKKIAKRYFTNEEWERFSGDGATEEAFLKMWTLKEARAKLDGRGLSSILSDKDTAHAQHTWQGSVRVGDSVLILSLCCKQEIPKVNIYIDSEVYT